MKVFRIRLNSNKYQSFLPVDDKVWQSELLTMDCQEKQQDWTAPSVYIDNPKLIKGNFFDFCSGAFVVDSIAHDVLQEVLEWAGEILPLPHKDELFHLVNVRECVNCLDELNTKWVIGKTTGAKIRIEQYEFLANRFSESTLFKIPETAKGEMLTVTGIKDPEDEFKTIVERAGLTGIIFEELWSDEK